MRTQTTRLSTVNALPTRFAVSLLSSLSSSQVPASRTSFIVTPLIKVRSAKVRPRYFVRQQHDAWGTRHHLRGPLHSDLNVERVVTAIWRPRNCSKSECSIRIPSFRLRNSPDVLRTCFDRRPLLGDNYGFRRRVEHSDEYSRMESSVPLSPLLLVWQACTRCSLQSPESVCCPFVHAVCVAASFRRCRCRTCSSDTQRTPPASTTSSHQAGL